MEGLFALTPRVCIASLILYWLANILDVHLYHFIKSKIGCFMWLRNNVATMICQTLQAFFFAFFSFYGVFGIGTIVEVAFTTAAIECVVAFFDTPFLYLARVIHRNMNKHRKEST